MAIKNESQSRMLLRSVKGFFKKNIILLSVFLIFGFTASVITIYLPYLIGGFIDILIARSEIQFILEYCIVFSILSLTSIILKYVTNRMFVRINVEAIYWLQNEIISQIRKISLFEIERHNSAGLSQQLRADVNTIVNSTILTVQNIIANFVLLVIPITALAIIDRNILLFMLFILILYSISLIYIAKPLKERNLELIQSETQYYQSFFSQQFFLGFQKRHMAYKLFDKDFKASFIKKKKESLAYQRIVFLFSSMDDIIATSAQIWLFFYGGQQIIEGVLTVGEFTIISSYFGLTLNGAKYFFGLGKIVQELKVAFNRTHQVLTLQKEKGGSIITNEISTIRANINYTIQEKEILSNLALNFEKGNIYIIQGRNGSGKTCLLNILAGVYSSDSEILFNGVSIEKYNLYAMRRKTIGFLEQFPPIIKGSILDNITLMSSDTIDMDRLIHLSQILNFSDFVKQTGEGYDTFINDEQMKLSGGEKQKIGLLRLLYKQPKLMLLDEPTSSLDDSTKSNLMSYLNSIKDERIIIITTHESLSELNAIKIEI